MKTVKLLVCYHKPDTLLKDEILTPIHLGRALAKKQMAPDDPKLKWLLENMIGDDTGDNISELNRSYNELTSLYWAWKNYDKLGSPDFIGLMHYRRHFVLNEGEIKVYEIPDMESEHYFDALNYSPEKLLKELEGCDFVCHLGKVNGIYKHYLANHRIEDMELALDILKKMFPNYSKIADEYMKQDIGNFCNMFIFPKEMFFEYCEFIFGILEEFRQRTDISEKRFFISERLTGIFIYEKMKQGLKYKVFPINFVCEKINIPIAYPLTNDNGFSLTVSMVSALENADKNTSFTFYLMHDKSVGQNVKDKFNQIVKLYPQCQIEFIESEQEPEYYPLEISELLPKINKLIYFNEKAIAMHDLGEFYRTCNVDDYYISGVPETYATNESENRKLVGDIFMLNCRFLRNHRIWEKARDFVNRRPAMQIINDLCANQIGYFADWFVTCAGEEIMYDRVIRAKYKNRGQYQLEATWRPVLYFGKNAPWLNIQGLYSNFWWNYAVKTPMLFKFPYVDIEKAIELLNEQQRELNHIEDINRRSCADDIKKILPDDSYNPMTVYAGESNAAAKMYANYKASLASLDDYEYPAVPKAATPDPVPAPVAENDGSALPMGYRIKRYYKQFGIKKTVKRAFEKLGGK
ncbi:MAG: DUF4422 domain-containing protein [Lachnospiraceae bacterium]|nr:DUF4422 domain-containing protein [Lachnospiraceae bacterium]